MMFKKIIYGCIGLLVGVIFYLNLASGIQKIPIVKSHKSEFKVTIDDNWDNDEEDYFEKINHKSYHVPREVLGALSNSYLFPTGRLNPMQFWLPRPVLAETLEEVDSQNTGETINTNNQSDTSDSQGGSSISEEESKYNAYNTKSKKYEKIDISSLLDDFELAQLPISRRGYRVTSRFGSRVDPVKAMQNVIVKGNHLGFDVVNEEIGQISGKSDVEIVSSLNGIIIEKSTDGGYGNFVEIDHGEFTIIYAHLDSFNEEFNIGDEVFKGELLGFVGTTGNSTGPHLHFEVTKGDYKINPATLFDIMLSN